MRPVGVALVGYGYAGKTFHAPLIAAAGGLRLHTVVSSQGAPVSADWPEAKETNTVLRVDGGMVASDWTMQRLADLLDAPVDRPTVLETTALGAAWLAGSRAGIGATAAQARAAQVLAAMQELGFASPQDTKLALAQPARPAGSRGGGSANYVADLVMDVLDDFVGKFETDIVVQTTVDPALQATAEKALTDTLNANGARYNVGQGALVSMRPDGAIRALIGGRDYAQSQFNRATTAKRQPGSSFKPFVYLTAVERGYTPDMVLEHLLDRIEGRPA